MNYSVTFQDIKVSVDSYTWELFLYSKEVKQLGPISVIIGLVTIVCNIFVIVSSGLLFKRELKSKCTYLLLGNIAITDALSAVVVMMLSIYQNDPTSRHPCSVYVAVYGMSAIVSFYSVTFIALDRYLYIVHGLKYSSMVYPRRVKNAIIGTWIFGIVVGFIPIMIWTKSGPVCWYTFNIPLFLILIIFAIIGIPVPVIIFLYSIILRKAIKNAIKIKRMKNNINRIDNLRNEDEQSSLRFFIGGVASSKTNETSGTETNNEEANNLQSIVNKSTQHNPNKWKAVKIVTLTAGNVLFIWILYSGTILIFVLCDWDNDAIGCGKLQLAVARYIGLLGFTHHIYNPVIYYWWHNGFRNIIKRLLRKEDGI